MILPVSLTQDDPLCWEHSLPLPVRGGALHGARVLDLPACRQLETELARGLPAHALMRRAGVACARLLMARYPATRHVVVLAGGGNNGGDGWVCAWFLRHYFAVTVTVLDLAPSGQTSVVASATSSDAQWARQLAQRQSVTVLRGQDAVAQSHVWTVADVFVDALFGIGLTRPLDGEAKLAAQSLLSSGKPVLSVDIPSGLCSSSGQPLGDVCVRADVTLTMLALKPGVLTGQAQRYCGEIWLAPLGASTHGRGDASDASDASADAVQTPAATLVDRDEASEALAFAQHKGERGDVWVIGGSAGMQGAAMLCAQAAMHAGAGRVYVVRPDQAREEGALFSAPTSLEIMTRRFAEALLTLSTLSAQRASRPSQRCAIVAGPGGGEAIAACLADLLALPLALVLDADALNALARDEPLQQQLRARSALTVLTPHPLEAARLLGQDLVSVQGNRLQAARTLAHRLNAWVVLKGAGTVVANPAGKSWIIASGNALLATAGSGDVLAGFIAARLAATLDATQCLAAVWEHGQRAERLRAMGRRVIVASELYGAQAQM